MHDELLDVTGGVDTHGDVHVAAALDGVGRVLATASFPTDRGGYCELLAWLRTHGRVQRVGVEGTGSYGAGLARSLTAAHVDVVEVNRPDRQRRRRHGKSDTTDAIAAARAALNGDATAIPKATNGPVEAIRALHVVRRSALKARTQAANQIRDLIVTAPEALRGQLKGLTLAELVARCGRLQAADLTDPTGAMKQALRLLAHRHHNLDIEVAQLDTDLAELTARANPALIAARGVGPDTAATLLVTAGDNAHRMSSEAGFAALCGASPVEASSGKITRHRLNRGGDRHANSALWRIVMVRLSCDQRTKNYAARRRAEGRSDREIIRCLKRAVAREVFCLLTDPPPVHTGADLRATRTNAGITLTAAAEQLGTWATHLSRLERGLSHNADLAKRYHAWLQRIA